MIFEFSSQIVDGDTYIHLNKTPNFDVVTKLKTFLRKKRGDFISVDKKSFRIERKFDSVQLQALFKENRLSFFSIKNKKKEEVEVLKNIDIDTDGYESLIVSFGIHKGKTYGELEESYLKWVKENHFDKKIKEIATNVLDKRNVVYIDVSKYK